MSRPKRSGARQRRWLTIAVVVGVAAWLTPASSAQVDPVTVAAVTPQSSAPVVTFNQPDPGTTVHLWRADGFCSDGNALVDTGVTGDDQSTSLSDSTAVAEHHYCYSVHVTDGFLDVDSNHVDVHFDVLAPDPPTAVLAPLTTSVASVSVSFTASGSPDVLTQRLYRATGTCALPGAFTLITSGGSPLVDTGMADGTYCYDVRAWDGDQESAAQSATAQVRVDTHPPPPPTSVQAVSPTNQQPVVSFDVSQEPADVEGYDLFRSDAACPGNGTFNLVAAGAGSALTDTTIATDGSEDGTYCYLVRATDGVNPSADSSKVEVRVDTVAPSPPTGVQAEVTPTTSNPVIDFTQAGDADITGYHLYRSDAACPANGSLHQVGSSGPGATSITDSTISANGDYCYLVRSFDGANESLNSDTADVRYDGTAPPAPASPQLLNGQPGGFVNAQPQIGFDISGEPGDVVEYRLYRHDGQCSGSGFSLVASGGPSTTQLTDGTLATDGSDDTAYCYVVRAWDGVQESSDSATVPVILDTLAPDTTITAQPPAETNDTSPSFSFTASEPVQGFECSLDGSAFAACTSPDVLSVAGEGPHTFQVRAIDRAGNVDPTPAIATWTLDTTAPTAAFDSVPSGYVASRSAHLTFHASEVSTFECNSGSGWAACTGPGPATSGSDDLTGLSQGQQSLQIRATDAAGNVSAVVTSSSWTVDTIPPVASIDSHPGDPTSSTDASFEFSATDANPIDHFVCTLDSQVDLNCASPKTYSGLAQGQHHFSVEAFDAAGNTDTASFTWTIDTNAPVLTIDSGPSGPTNQSDVSFAFHSNKTPTSFKCQLDGGANQSCTSPKPYNGLSDGAHTFTLQGTDNAGNSSTVTRSFTVDTTPPTSHITVPSAGDYVGDGSVTITATASDAGGTGIQLLTFAYSRDGSHWTTIGSTDPGHPSVSWNTSGLADGAYQLRVVATDAAGNSAPSASVPVTLDDTGPAISGVMAGNAGIVSGATGALSATVTDGGAGMGAPATVTFTDSGAGQQPGAAVLGANSLYTANWDTRATNDGVYTLTVTARDSLGNTSTASIQVRVDNIPPDVPAAPTGPALTNQPPVLTWSAPPPGADVLGFNVYRNGTRINAATIPAGTTTYTDALPTNGSADGAYLYTIAATDTSHASGQSAPLAVIYDTTRPLAVTSVSTSENAGAVTVSWPAAADPTAGGVASGVSGYVVRRSAAGGPAPSTPGEGTGVCQVGAASLSCTDTATVAGATYAYSVFASDAAGNWSSAASGSVTVTGPAVPDRTPPGRPLRFHASALTNAGGRLVWVNPSDRDFDHVILVSGSKRPASPAKGKRVYSGKSTHATFAARAGTTVQFAIFAVDHSGNVSHGTFVGVKVPDGPLSPAAGATLTGSPLLSWKPVKGASYYNIQLYIGTKRMFSAWPKGTSYRVPSSKLTSGRTYTWYVWPGYGALRDAKYGKLIGKASFLYHR